MKMERDLAAYVGGSTLALIPIGAVGLVAFIVATMRARDAERQRWAGRLAIGLVVPLLCLTAPFGL